MVNIPYFTRQSSSLTKGLASLGQAMNLRLRFWVDDEVFDNFVGFAVY